MRYISHDFYSNLRTTSNANGALADDILMDELAYLIARERDQVIAVLTGAGIKLPSKPTDANIVSAMTKNFGNKNMLMGISQLIVKQNSESFKQANSNGDGGSPISLPTDPVSAVAGFFGKLLEFGTIKKQGELQEDQIEAQRELANKNLLTKIIGMKEGGQKRSNGLVILLILLGVGALTLLIVYLVKRK